ncbi:MAG TPA: hypothetical protein VIY28_03135 [Pseudonocardiaceae bacterium]
MATASIEVSGPEAEALARELRAVMAGAAREGEIVSAVEVDRSPELVIAVIGLVFSGVSTAKTLWDWDRLATGRFHGGITQPVARRPR